MRGLAVATRKVLEAYPAPVVAVDLPSAGMPTRASSSQPKPIVRTRSSPLPRQAGPRPGMLTRGPIVVAPIGSPPEAVESATGLTWAGASKVIADRPRSPNSNKGQFGHVLVIGGAKGKSSAPSMSSVAALRTGAGLVTAAVAQ